MRYLIFLLLSCFGFVFDACTAGILPDQGPGSRSPSVTTTLSPRPCHGVKRGARDATQKFRNKSKKAKGAQKTKVNDLQGAGIPSWLDRKIAISTCIIEFQSKGRFALDDVTYYEEEVIFKTGGDLIDYTAVSTVYLENARILAHQRLTIHAFFTARGDHLLCDSELEDWVKPVDAASKFSLFKMDGVIGNVQDALLEVAILNPKAKPYNVFGLTQTASIDPQSQSKASPFEFRITTFGESDKGRMYQNWTVNAKSFRVARDGKAYLSAYQASPDGLCPV